MSDQVKPGYAAFYSAFDINKFAQTLHGDLAGGVNACVECCDRYASGDKTTLIWAGENGEIKTYSFEHLQRRAAQVANLLTANGVKPGDRIAGLLPRIPELFFIILGTLRAGAVYQPLFTAFGPKAISHRLDGSGAKLIFTDIINRPKLDDVENCPPVITLGDGEFRAALDRQPAEFKPVLRDGDDLFLMLFTSGTTGLPKGVGVPLRGLLSFSAYMQYCIDLHQDDVFWNIADPGWAYGLYYAVIGPLLLGHATVIYEGPFTVEKTYALIDELGVTNFAGAPTAYRMLVAAGPEAAHAIKGKLRVASSAGEPLNPEVMRWMDEHLGCPLFDHYGQTETGMTLANHHGLRHAVHPASAGRPIPGFELAVVNDAGEPLPALEKGTLAVHRDRSPLFFFPGYWGAEGKDWVGNYYLTGDTVEQHDDGTISFVGRSDDLITSAGYRIGPFDVESCLIEHEAVVESAVVGKPDDERGEIVKAFVVLHNSGDGTDALRAALTNHVRDRLGKHAFPREIDFVDALPKTPSGKIQRFLLREK